MKKIIDEFTNLPVSHTRKWQFRNPEKAAAIAYRYKRRKYFSDPDHNLWTKEYGKQYYIRKQLNEL